MSLTLIQGNTIVLQKKDYVLLTSCLLGMIQGKEKGYELFGILKNKLWIIVLNSDFSGNFMVKEANTDMIFPTRYILLNCPFVLICMNK